MGLTYPICGSVSQRTHLILICITHAVFINHNDGSLSLDPPLNPLPWGGEFDTTFCQIPCIPPLPRGWGGFDKCIISIGYYFCDCNYYNHESS